jgi:hypothetical protein
MVPEPIMRRLAFIRYLSGLAEQQSRQPEPLAAASLLTFHDTVELFLVLAAEKHGITLRGEVGLMKRWDKLESKLAGAALPYRAGIERLNDLRIRLKHDGYIASSSDTEIARATVAAFLQQSTPLLFGIPFEQASMVELVLSAEARGSLAEAEALIEQGDLRASMRRIAMALRQVVGDYQAKTGARLHLTSRRFGEAYPALPADGPWASLGNLLASFRDDIDQLKSAMSVLLVGVDYSRYLRFMELTPSLAEEPDGTHKWLAKWVPRGWPTQEQCRFCFDFVVETAIHLQRCEQSAWQLTPLELLGRLTTGEMLDDHPAL